MKIMRKLAVIVLGVVLLSTAFVGVASAQQNPNVANLIPFSGETKFMSLSGYFRYLNHQVTGQWLTYAEAGRLVAQQ